MRFARVKTSFHWSTSAIGNRRISEATTTIGYAQSLLRFEYCQSLRKIFTKILWQNASLADSFWIRTKGDRVLPVAGKLIPFGRTGRQYPDGGHGFRPI